MIEYLNNFRFAAPWWLLALLLLPLVAWLRGRRPVAAIIVPFAGAWRKASLISGSRLPTFFAFLAAAAIVVALARPQSVATERQSKSKGYDIMLAIDLSLSMEAEDYVRDRQKINRLQAVKPVLNAFINSRENDRIGLIAFSGRAYTVAPLTFDHDWLAKQTERLQIGLIEDGTAIGDALAVATTRLLQGAKERAGEREGAFIILLTDGTNNVGMMQPLEGAALAAEAGIRVYTIAAGRNGYVDMPQRNQQGQRVGTVRTIMEVDFETLEQIARITNGESFRAGDSDTIQRAFELIDQSSEIEFEVRQFSVVTELFPYALALSGVFALISVAATVGRGKEALA